MKLSVAVGIVFLLVAMVCLIMPRVLGFWIGWGTLVLAGLATPLTSLWTSAAEREILDFLERLRSHFEG